MPDFERTAEQREIVYKASGFGHGRCTRFPQRA